MDTARALLEADPSCANAIGPSNQTPLCYAWSIEIAELLLDHGADMFAGLNTRNWKNHTPLRNAKGDVLRFLLNRAKIEHDIFIHCKLGEAEKVLAMVDNDAALLEATTNKGHVLGDEVPLMHLAIVHKQVPIVKSLLERGANVDRPLLSDNGRTPLHLAVLYGPTGFLDPIPDNLADIKEKGVLRLLPELPQLLLDYGAKRNLRDNERKWTPLEWAESNLEDEVDRTEVISLLQSYAAE